MDVQNGVYGCSPLNWRLLLQDRPHIGSVEAPASVFVEQGTHLTPKNPLAMRALADPVESSVRAGRKRSAKLPQVVFDVFPRAILPCQLLPQEDHELVPQPVCAGFHRVHRDPTLVREHGVTVAFASGHPALQQALE